MNTKYKQLQQAAGQRGFTIIEVVLVLAIAGLIFLMVFLALPALQRGQRDIQRREDLSRISTQINSYSTNSRGKIPTSATLSDFVTKYLGDGATSVQAGAEYADPSGVPSDSGIEGADESKGYFIQYGEGDVTKEGTVYYAAGFVCGDSGSLTSGKTRNYALRVKLENQAAPACIDNR